ncbi:GL24869 [Drosophila persimilis]|uniref:GL24869 n=1 Tax=Drosophila persimilis TaxID=7234 RepID=B4GRU6_DROPE|nr:GL24869 [Drosophila persimilis]
MPPKIVKPEAQAWFCVHQLLLNPQVMENYELNEARCKQLSKLLGLMHETLLDQLPVLIGLKQFLSRLTLSGNTTAKLQPLLLEDLPQIQNDLTKEVDREGGFYQIAQAQDSLFLSRDKKQICDLASRLSAAYGTELLCELEQNMADLNVQEGNPVSQPDSGAGGDTASGEQIKKCATCLVLAKKMCANCKKVHYCSRECQLKDWAKHKTACLDSS